MDRQIQLTKDLHVKVSDFGVSIWEEDKSIALNAAYYRAKDVYEVTNIQETLDYAFDFRSF